MKAEQFAKYPVDNQRVVVLTMSRKESEDLYAAAMLAGKHMKLGEYIAERLTKGVSLELLARDLRVLLARMNDCLSSEQKAEAGDEKAE